CRPRVPHDTKPNQTSYRLSETSRKCLPSPREPCGQCRMDCRWRNSTRKTHSVFCNPGLHTSSAFARCVYLNKYRDEAIRCLFSAPRYNNRQHQPCTASSKNHNKSLFFVRRL